MVKYMSFVICHICDYLVQYKVEVSLGQQVEG